MASWGSGQFLSIIILLAVLFGDCSGKEGTPKGVLSRQQMTHLLIQVHLLETKVARLGLTPDSAEVVYQHFEKLILQRAGVDSATFAGSFEYYSANPRLFTKVYNAVVDSLLERENREKLELERADSLLNMAKMDSTKLDSLRATSSAEELKAITDMPVRKVKRPTGPVSDEPSAEEMDQ